MCKFLLIVLLAYGSFVTAEDKIIRKDYHRPPIDDTILSGSEALNHIYVHEGFELNLFAEEPHVRNPVLMRFDHLGRLWVVEMVGYMNDLRGSKELEPLGRISILEDNDRDGKMDKTTVFLDKLIEPRAMAFHKNGILWADTKSLHFTELIDDYKPGKTTIVDESYSKGHSVEHKPNALLRGLDNWYYNAKSNKRYREIDGKWVVESTEFRNQFGLSMDDYGRLYHGQQNTFLRADIFTPRFFMRNKNLDLRTGGLATKNNEIIDYCYNVKVNEKAVFPIRTSYDIRDGYLTSPGPDIDETGYAFRSTSAVSHFYYRDNYFPSHFDAFIPDPALHIVKVITIDRKEGIPYGKNTFKDREIISGADTRFRPIDIQSAPDGTLFIADMYHGILQHKVFMSKPLKAFILKNKLESTNDLGRVYRLTVKGKKPNSWKPFKNISVSQLVNSLASENPWARDTAQRLLVDGQSPEAAKHLEEFITKSDSQIGKVHALWVLEGLSSLKEKHVLTCLKSSNDNLVTQSVRVSWKLENTETLMKALMSKANNEFGGASYYLLQRLANFSHPDAQAFVAKCYAKWSTKPYLAKAVLSGGGAHTKEWVDSLEKDLSFKDLASLYKKSVITKKKAPKNHLKGKDLASYNKGEEVYKTFCFACHGASGEGMKDMGPPLALSEWVSGDETTLIKIALKGMEGPITVKGKKYTPKVIMTPFEALLKDNQIADVLTYVRNSWGNRSKPVSVDNVKKLRDETKERKFPYSEKDFKK